MKAIAVTLAITIMVLGLSACDKKNSDDELNNGERDLSVPTKDWEAEDAKTKYAEINKYGNSGGNCNNYGLASIQGEWIYYLSNRNQIYKIHTDGSENTLVCGDYGLWLNVIGDWIYYASFYGGIFRIRTDGTDWEHIIDDNAGYINIAGDWVYYSNADDDEKLYKAQIDGSGRTQLNNDESQFINVVDDIIYYVNISEKNGNWEIYKMNTAGAEREVVVSDKNCEYINVINGFIYYVYDDENYDDYDEYGDSGKSNMNIYKMHVSGGTAVRINDDESICMNVDGDWIYYSNQSDDGKIYRIRTDGTEKMKLNNDNSEDINIVGNWIYYRNFSDINPDTNSATTYKMRPDGSDRQSVA
ncbi:MAG: DUF5050 domain-containing protein [Oscillospiraceae bacterium]|nr:DUF5050 domain-containing protein [Oscillospiraceae bacterium]